MLKRAFRLRKRGSFAYVRAHGAKVNEREVSYVVVRGRGKRVGFIVSNKIGKAVRRNLVKRRMRGVIGEIFDRVREGQMIFIARVGIEKLTYGELKTRMLAALERAGMLKA